MKKERKGMSYCITETLHTTIDTGESYITQIAPSAKGRSFFGETLELLDREGSLVVSSIQRHLKMTLNQQLTSPKGRKLDKLNPKKKKQ